MAWFAEEQTVMDTNDQRVSEDGHGCGGGRQWKVCILAVDQDTATKRGVFDFDDCHGRCDGPEKFKYLEDIKVFHDGHEGLENLVNVSTSHQHKENTHRPKTRGAAPIYRKVGTYGYTS
jgi:hypothetical protein